MRVRFAVPFITVCCAAIANGVRTEEGFWPFDMVPKEIIARRYEFDITDEWLDKARCAALRVSSGGSGSFVSAHGLAMTNRHVVGTALQRLSVPGKTDLIRDGFLAKTQAQELKAAGLRLEQLVEIANVNERVRDVVERLKFSEAVAFQAIALEAEKNEKREHVKIQAVKLYPEGEYRLYTFKVYDDVRIVFAADLSSGYFGGDQENFTYPRYDFDVAFVRAYENGKPAETPDHFAWSPAGVKENELVFFAGNPGQTERSITLAHLELERDKILPAQIALRAREGAVLRRFAELGADQSQAVQDRQNHLENALKRQRGQLDGLRDPSVFERKKAEEEDAARSISDPEKARAYASALATMRHAVERISSDQLEFELLGSPWGLFSAQLATAVAIAGMEETGAYNFKAAEQREARFEALYLYDPARRDESERRQLEESFSFLAAQLRAEHPLSKLVLEGKSPAERAAELVSGSQLGRPEFYKNAASEFPGIEKSGDPMLILARKILRRMRALNQRQQSEFVEAGKKCYAAIAQALGQSKSARRAPDGNFTPRLSYGTVRGYDDGGRFVRPFTCFGCMYELCDRAVNKEPYHLNATWLAGRGKLNPCTPLNFVTDADGFGGNSGSPVFNRNRELVGMLFDGNYPGLLGKYMYDERTKRSVCVDARAIVDVLERVYGATELVAEFAR